MHSFFSCVAPLKCAKNMLQILHFVFWIVLQTLQTLQNLLPFPWSFVLLVGLLPVVSAAPSDDPFSGITFRAFSEFVEQNFSSRISLTTVLVVLFTMTNNSDVLNLVKIQDDFSKQLTICQTLTMTKAILLLQSN